MVFLILENLCEEVGISMLGYEFKLYNIKKCVSVYKWFVWDKFRERLCMLILWRI